MTGRRAALLVLAPAAPFLLVAVAAAVGWIPDEWYYLGGDVAALALALAALSSGLAALLAWRAAVGRRRVRLAAAEARAAAQAAAGQDRAHFLQRLDHEITSPLGEARAVLAWLETTPLNAAQQRGLAELHTQLRRVGDLTTDMRRVADLRTRLLDLRPVDVEQLAREALQIVQGEGAAQTFVARGGRLTCERKTPWPLRTVLGDADLLSLALGNLLQNACKFTEPTGQVRVVVGEERPGVTIEVIDTGRGIPQDDLARVGQELYRGQNVGDLPGRGLGLALARAIVERHKGTLEIRSTAGQGTMTTVWLPRNKEESP